MPRQCYNPKCIGSKKRLTSHKYKNKEKDPRPSSTSRRSSSDSSKKRNKRTQKPESRRSSDGSKNSRTSLNESKDYKNKKRQASRSISGSSTSTYSSRKLRTTNTFGQGPSSSRDCKKQICTCRSKDRRGTRSGNLHGHANSRSTDSVERSKRPRKRSHRRRKKASKRESDRRDCFATLCVCVRGRSSDELRACKCTSPHEISSRRECYSVKGGQEGKGKRVTRKNASKTDTRVDRYTAGPSTTERKSALKHSRELSVAKPNEERSVIIGRLNTVRRGIDRFNTCVIKLVTRQQ